MARIVCWLFHGHLRWYRWYPLHPERGSRFLGCELCLGREGKSVPFHN
jgi:hypothetical protein